MAAALRFDEGLHRYTELATGRELPHITGMLERSGWVNARWYTDESRERGTAVHKICAAYDLDAVDLAACVSPYRGWLLAYAKVTAMVRPQWTHVEEPFVHELFWFAGTPDRVGLIYDAVAVADLKSGAPEKSHAIQTALQAILVAPHVNLPAEAIHRYGWYLQSNGKARVERFDKPQDFIEAHKVIRQCCY